MSPVETPRADRNVLPTVLTASALAIVAGLLAFYPLALVGPLLTTFPVVLVILWAARDVQDPIDRILAADAARARAQAEPRATERPLARAA